MAVTAYTVPSAAAGTNWTNPTNVYSSDNNRATYANSGQNDLKITGFGFLIPTGSTILGIEVIIEGNGSSSTASNRSIRIGATKDGSALAGSRLANQNLPQTTDGNLTFGSATNLFSTTFTPAEINASTFGILLSAGNTNTSTRSIDQVRVRIYYAPPISSIHDNFNDNSIDSVKWATSLTSSATVVESSGKIIITPANSTVGSKGVLYGQSNYNFTSGICTVEVPQVADTANVYTELNLMIDSNNYIAMSISGGNLQAYYFAGGGFNSVATVAYNATDHRWWRIREANGTIYWDYSADGKNWVNFTKVANPIAVTSLNPALVGDEHTSDATPGAAHFDNFNIKTIFEDTFTEAGGDTLLQSHTPDIGTSWTRLYSDTSDLDLLVNATTDTLRSEADTSDHGVIYTADATYKTPDYFIETIFTDDDIQTYYKWYWLLRVQDSDNMYAFVIFLGTGASKFYKKVSGSWTAIGSGLTMNTDFVNGDRLKIEVVGSTLNFYVNGVLKITTTDSAITAAGKAGVATGGGSKLIDSTDDASTIWQWDNFSVNFARDVADGIDTISDNFNDNSIDTGLWNEYEANSGAVTETNNQLEYQLAASTIGSWCGLHSKLQYSLVGRSVTVKVPAMSGSGDDWFDLTLSMEQLPYVDNFFSIGINFNTGNIEAVSEIGGDDSVLATVAYNSTDHRYFRLRESAGTIYWEYSTDGVSWTTLHSRAVFPEIPVTSLYIVLDDYEYSGSTSPGLHKFDDLNILGTPTNSERSATLTGEATANSERSATITGKSTSNSERAATLIGEAAANSERSGHLYATDTTNSERSAHTAGKLTSNDERAATLIGEAQANSERGGHLVGDDTSNSERAAVLTGEASANSERSAHLIGTADTNDERSAHLVGKDSATAERGARLTGIELGTSSERGGHTTGEATANSERSATLTGELSTSSERQATLIGEATANSERSGHLVGKDTANSERGATLTGEAVDNSERAAIITGKAAANSERSGHLVGKSTLNEDRSATLIGEAQATSERSGHMVGTDTANAERAAHLTGYATDSSERSATIIGEMYIASEVLAHLFGFDTAYSERYGKLTGFDTAFSERGARLTGKLMRARPSVLPPGKGTSVLGSRGHSTPLTIITPTNL